MASPNIPATKRAGLPVDLQRLTADGDDWLSAEERYALKMHGVCAQAQPGVFMVRVRTGGGRISTDSAHGLAVLADRYSSGWLHLTTRQQIEFHNVAARDVTTVLAGVRALGLTNRSTCGHTMRGVMACADAGVSLEEPFDCHPDANAVSASILARTPELDARMPQRINIAFGGCPACRDHAKVNDAGFVSVIRDDGELGYELWLGGSLGKAAPTLGVKAADFVARADVLAAANALFDVYVAHGNHDKPGRARLKYLIAELGVADFLDLYHEAYRVARRKDWPAPAPVGTPLSASLAEILACAPEDGWGSGVRPQRVPGRALVTVNVPLGDLYTDELRVLADLAADVADERLHLSKNQNVVLRHVPIESVPTVRARIGSVGLALEGADQARDVRACIGGPVCDLAITPAQELGTALLDNPVLARNSGLRIAVSGCPNACAQHQIADVGLSGGKVTIGGASQLGYQVWLGGDLRREQIGQVVGRVAATDVPAIVRAIAGIWEALRDAGEPLSVTVQRLGVEGFAAQIDGVFRGRWEPGPEPEPVTGPDGRNAATLPLVAVA